MIDLMNIKIANAINNKQDLSKVFSKQELDEYISRFVYPVGSINFNNFDNSKSYRFANYNEEKTYLTNVFTYLFSDYYSEKEINIITIGSLTKFERRVIIQDPLLSDIMTIINETSDKEEIQYYIDELKFKYLTSLSVKADEKNIETINKLVAELSPIEADHNNLNLALRKV